MPAFCKNLLTIETKSEEDAEFLLSKFISYERYGKSFLSFESLIPRPNEVCISCGNVSFLAENFLFAKDAGEDEESLKGRFADEVKDYNFDTQDIDDQNYPKFGEGYDGFVKYAEAYKNNIAKYGAPTWYEWSLKNWGTKWDAIDVKLKRDKTTLSFEFDTAWTPPVLIFEYIANTFKDNIKSMLAQSGKKNSFGYFEKKYI